MKEWIEAALAVQGIKLAAGRAEKMAPGIQALLDAAAKDPLRGELQFEADPTTYLGRIHK